MNTYRLTTLADLLAVPIERRAACLRELEYALDLYDFAFGDSPEPKPEFSVVWTDDGNKSVDLTTTDGEPLLRLEVTDGA